MDRVTKRCKDAEEMTMVSFLVPLELARAVRVRAAELDKSRSAAIRDALRLWLESQKDKDG